MTNSFESASTSRACTAAMDQIREDAAASNSAHLGEVKLPGLSPSFDFYRGYGKIGEVLAQNGANRLKSE